MTRETGAHLGPTVVFVSYTGLLEPLGQSQVLPYARGLAALGHRMAIVSFERHGPSSSGFQELAGRLRADGIEWQPLQYHKRPPVLSTAFDVWRGVRKVLALVARGARLVHARSHVPALVGDIVRAATRCPFMFDHRGLMADEYADSGNWKRGGLLFRSTERLERRFVRNAAGVVVLTDALRLQVHEANSIQVIPCAVDLDRFRPRARGESACYDLVYAGSWSGLYLVEETLAFHAALRQLRPDSRMLLLVPRESGPPRGPVGVDVQHATPAEVPALLRRARAGVSFRRGGRAQTAASPVKVSEYWATGLPVVTTAGVGDLDGLIAAHGVGVSVGDLGTSGLAAAARALCKLLAEPAGAVSERCRRLAEERYDVPRAVAAYDAMYRTILGPVRGHTGPRPV